MNFFMQNRFHQFHLLVGKVISAKDLRNVVADRNLLYLYDKSHGYFFENELKLTRNDYKMG